MFPTGQSANNKPMPLAAVSEYDDTFAKIREYHDKYPEHTNDNNDLIGHDLELRQWCLLCALMQVAYKTTIPNSSGLKIFKAKIVGVLDSAYKGWLNIGWRYLANRGDCIFQQFVDAAYDVLPHITDGLKQFAVALVNFTNFDNGDIGHIASFNIKMGFFDKINALTLDKAYDVADVKQAIRICGKLDGGAGLINFTASATNLITSLRSTTHINRNFNLGYYKRFDNYLDWDDLNYRYAFMANYDDYERDEWADLCKARKDYEKKVNELVTKLLRQLQDFADNNGYDVQTVADNLAKFYSALDVSNNYYNMLVASEQLLDFNSDFYADMTSFPLDVWSAVLTSKTNSRFASVGEYCSNIDTLFSKFYDNYLKPSNRFISINYGPIVKKYDLRGFAPNNGLETELSHDLTDMVDVPAVLNVINVGIKGIVDAYGVEAASVICGATLNGVYNICENLYKSESKRANKINSDVKFVNSSSAVAPIIDISSDRILDALKTRLNNLNSAQKLCFTNAKVDISDNIPACFMLAIFFNAVSESYDLIADYRDRKEKFEDFNIVYDYPTFINMTKSAFKQILGQRSTRKKSFGHTQPANSKTVDKFWNNYICELQNLQGYNNYDINSCYSVIVADIMGE